MIGMTLKYRTLAGNGAGTAEGAFVEAYGGLDRALEALRRQGVGSIEVSMVHSGSPVEAMLEIVRRIQGAGLEVTLHGTLEDLPASRWLEVFSPVFAQIFAKQSRLSVTVHGMVDLPLTKAVTADWAKVALAEWPGIVLATENQRVRQEDAPGQKAHFRIDAIPATLPDLPNTGICWDMGHYAYNVLRAGLPVETLPLPETLRRVVHTHIHGIKDMDTHHCIEAHPIAIYIAGLKSAGYAGIYNIEVKPDKLVSYMDAREGMERSVANLREILGE